jgi:hypothetical protein
LLPLTFIEGDAGHSRLFETLGNLFQYMFCPGLVTRKICLKKIGEKEYFQHREQDKKLDKNYEPQFSSHSHGSKTIYIKV